DDMVIIDSGSTDNTEQIARKFNTNFIFRELDNFKNQRIFSYNQCKYRWIMMFDSDEVPDDTYLNSIVELKKNNFLYNGRGYDLYRVLRKWYVLGTEVHVFYPLTCPDSHRRIFDSHKVKIKPDTNFVHENMTGYDSSATLPGYVLHYAVDSIDILYRRLDLYTTLAAQDLKRKGRKSNLLISYLHAMGAWVKWYFKKGGFRDGRVGWILGKYAFNYTFIKYQKLQKL
ncbi:MAG: glycosyltransferase family 2 protein, partial [Candidatus Zixiibacteriota bacterium]